MINIKTFQCNPVQENCYVVSDDQTREAVVIDCGAYYLAERQAVVSYIGKEQLRPTQVLCTHAHFDHVFGVDTLYESYGLKPRMHSDDERIYRGIRLQVEVMLGVPFTQTMPPPGESLSDGELLSVGSHPIRVLHTPGHSPGSVVFYMPADRVAFCGDTLFRMSVGRTDLDGGSWSQLMSSLSGLVSKLPPDVTVFSGHGPRTTMADELLMNPYLKP